MTEGPVLEAVGPLPLDSTGPWHTRKTAAAWNRHESCFSKTWSVWPGLGGTSHGFFLCHPVATLAVKPQTPAHHSDGLTKKKKKKKRAFFKALACKAAQEP